MHVDTIAAGQRVADGAWGVPSAPNALDTPGKAGGLSPDDFSPTYANAIH